MRDNGGALSFEASIRDINFNAVLTSMENRIRGTSNTVVQETSRIDTAFQSLGRLAVGTIAIAGLAQLPKQILEIRGSYQQLEIAFATMLRSKSKADALLRDVTEFAAKTPFSLKETATGAKQLLAYGFAAKDLIPTLSRLGDVSAGLGLPLERLTYLYGTTKTQGRLFAQDLNQFVGSGIPLISELAKQFGVSDDKVRQLVEDGKVGFTEVKKAIESMTSGSGIFAGTLDAQSKSLLALRERLSSAYELMLNDIGKKNEGLAASLLNTATSAVENYQQFLDILKVVAVTYGVAKAATLLYSIAQTTNIAITAGQAIAQAQAANAAGFLTLSQIRAAAATSLLSRAQVALNASILANPYVLAASAIAALVTYLVVFREETQKIKTAQELLAESAKSVDEKFNTQRSEVSALISILKNQNIAESERLKAYNKLNEIAPTVLANLEFQKAKTADLTSTLNEYLVSLKQQIRLEAGRENLKIAYQQEVEAVENKTKALAALQKVSDQANAAEKKRGTQTIGPDGSGGAAGAANALKVAAAKKNLEELVQKENEATAERTRVEEAYGKITKANTREALEAAKAQAEVQLASADKNSLTYKNAEDAVKSYTEQIDKLNKAQATGAKEHALSVGELTQKIKEQQELLDKQTTRAGTATVQAEIARLETQKRRLTGEQTAEEKRISAKAAKEAEKSGPYGSIDYWEQISRKASEIIEKAKPGDTDLIAKQSAVKFNADKQVEDLRKQYAVKSFEDELADKKQQYELYTKWVEAYGKDSADKQFATLTQSGQSYLDFLNGQIALLESKKDAGTLTTDDTKNLGNLIGQRDDVTGRKTAIDAFNESLQKAQTETGSLSEYLTVLKGKQDELNNVVNPFSVDYTKKKQALAEEIVRTEQQLKDQLNQFLLNYAGSEQQQLAIHTQYDELRASLDKKYLNNKGQEYKTALDAINSDEQKAQEDFQQRQLEQTDAYKKTTKTILEEGEKRLKIQIKNQEDVVVEAKRIGGIESEVYKKALSDLKSLQDQAGGTGLQKMIGQYSQYVGEFGQALSQLGGEAGEVGTMLVGLASNMSLVSQAMKTGVDKSQLYSIAIQGLVGIFSAITSAAEKRKQAETAYYQSLISQQSQYNLLLNEQLGIQAKTNENVFVKDFAGELKAGFDQYDQAQLKYQEALKKLNQGQAKAGLKTVLDSKTAIDLIGSGAATGAAIGTLAGGPAGALVGALVGGIVGGITSLFGGASKKADEFGNLIALYPDLIKKSKDGVDELNTSLAQSLIDNNLLDDSTKALVQSTIDWQKQVEAAREQIKAIIGDLAGQLGDKLRDSLVSAFEDGTDSAKAFSSSVSAILEDLVTKMLFSKAFNAQFQKLQDDLTQSLDLSNGGDGNTIDDFQRFTEGSKDSLALYNQWLAQFKEAAKASGFDVLSTSGASASQATAATNAVKALTEETGSLLVGQVNAMRIAQANANATMTQQLLVLGNIDRNTARIERSNELLDKLNGTMSGLTDGLRAKGIL